MGDKFRQLQDVSLNLDPRQPFLFRGRIPDGPQCRNYGKQDEQQQAYAQRFENKKFHGSNEIKHFKHDFITNRHEAERIP
jgi:hypothetical protein